MWKLENFPVPDTVKEIYSMAFAGCESLKKFYLNKNITKLYDNIFYGCKKQ